MFGLNGDDKRVTTPTRLEIKEKATELYFRDNPFIENNPEYQELLESGYISVAQSMLMRIPYKQFEPDKPTRTHEVKQ